MSAVLFGSISALADTSELQRAAFNSAFEAHGLDWRWERLEYQDMLANNGGQQRIADYASERGEQVDAAAVHETKSRRFRDTLASVAVTPRPGVVETIQAAKEQGWRVALVTTTSHDNVTALLATLEPALGAADFDLVVDSFDVEQPKPQPDAYRFALDKLGEQAGDCIAIEDNVGGTRSAAAAGIPCVAFANANTAGHDFGPTPRLAHLQFAELAGLVSAA